MPDSSETGGKRAISTTGSIVSEHNEEVYSAARSCCDSKRIEIAIQASQVAPIFFPAQHRITQQFPHTCQFLPSAFPSRISDRQIEQL